MKKYAFILLGPHYQPEVHQTTFALENTISYIKTARTFEEAKALVLELVEDGVKAIEVCGAFGEEQTKELIACTENKIAIGYVTHFPDQDSLFADFFSKD